MNQQNRGGDGRFPRNPTNAAERRRWRDRTMRTHGSRGGGTGWEKPSARMTYLSPVGTRVACVTQGSGTQVSQSVTCKLLPARGHWATVRRQGPHGHWPREGRDHRGHPTWADAAATCTPRHTCNRHQRYAHIVSYMVVLMGFASYGGYTHVGFPLRGRGSHSPIFAGVQGVSK